MKGKTFCTKTVFLAVAALISVAFDSGARGQTSAALTAIYTFTGGADGGKPYDGLIQGSDGNLYGMTAPVAGGNGTVFKLTPAGVLTTLYTFTGGADGARPRGALTQGSDGNFYGTTCEGGSGKGANGYGTVFKSRPPGF
jgi:uncharacterized repeat protein (TIGR03803 family)